MKPATPYDPGDDEFPVQGQLHMYLRHAFVDKCGCILLGRVVRRAYAVRRAVTTMRRGRAK